MKAYLVICFFVELSSASFHKPANFIMITGATDWETIIQEAEAIGINRYQKLSIDTTVVIEINHGGPLLFYRNSAIHSVIIRESM